MLTLEEILQQYFGCNGNAFRKNGQFTNAGEKAYFKLIDFLHHLEALEIIPSAEKAERVVDDIIEHSY